MKRCVLSLELSDGLVAEMKCIAALKGVSFDEAMREATKNFVKINVDFPARFNKPYARYGRSVIKNKTAGVLRRGKGNHQGSQANGQGKGQEARRKTVHAD